MPWRITTKLTRAQREILGVLTDGGCIRPPSHPSRSNFWLFDVDGHCVRDVRAATVEFLQAKGLLTAEYVLPGLVQPEPEPPQRKPVFGIVSGTLTFGWYDDDAGDTKFVLLFESSQADPPIERLSLTREEAVMVAEFVRDRTVGVVHEFTPHRQLGVVRWEER